MFSKVELIQVNAKNMHLQFNIKNDLYFTFVILESGNFDTLIVARDKYF